MYKKEEKNKKRIIRKRGFKYDAKENHAGNQLERKDK